MKINWKLASQVLKQLHLMKEDNFVLIPVVDDEKHYQECLKLRAVLEQNFNLVSICDGWTEDGIKTTVRTDTGLKISWLGNFHTKEESLEMKLDHLEGDKE